MTRAMTAEATRSIRVLIVDDEPDMRLLLRSLLDIDERFEVVAEAADGAAGIEAFDRLKPDLLILDQRMPVLDGLEMARRVLQDNPGHPIVLLSAYVNDLLRDEALALGVRRVLSKSAILDLGPELIRALS